MDEQNPLVIETKIIPLTNMSTGREIINDHMADPNLHVSQLFQLLTLMEV